MTATDLMALAPLLVMGATVLATVLAVAASGRSPPVLAPAGTALALAVLWQTPQRAMPLLIIDGYALFFLGLILAATLAVLLLAHGTVVGRTPAFPPLLLLGALGAMAVVAANHFAAVRAIAGPLELAVQLGLGYLTLGQGSHTLSGGEAQRLKLILELAKKRRTETLYVLDEPSTGLHLEDVRKLLGVLHALVDRGDTLVVIEHQLDIVKEADWLVDLGPGAGEAGGTLTWQGGVRDLLKSKVKSPTAQALRA